MKSLTIEHSWISRRTDNTKFKSTWLNDTGKTSWIFL
jgi:hypothetical protein